MLTLSIRQPWAWLIVHGYKTIENRTWQTAYRGPILIHAGLRMITDDYDTMIRAKLACTSPFEHIPIPTLQELRAFCGGIVGQAVLDGCVIESDSPWFCGPYGFVIRDAKPLPFRHLKGKLKLFSVKG